MQLRRAVTLEAPGHAQRFRLVNDGHCIDLAVAAVTTDAAVHVHGVVEIDVVGRLVDADPFHRCARCPAGTDRGQLRTLGFDLRVTRHAGLGVRDIRVRGDLHMGMTISAVHPELLHVDGVGKGRRLLRHVAHVGVFRGEIIPDAARHHRAENQHNDQQLQGQPVRPAWKKICHPINVRRRGRGSDERIINAANSNPDFSLTKIVNSGRLSA